MITQASLKLTDSQVDFIEETLSNNEVSPNEELIELFVEDGIPLDAATKVLEHRMAYIMNIFIGNNTPLRNGTQTGFPF